MTFPAGQLITFHGATGPDRAQRTLRELGRDAVELVGERKVRVLVPSRLILVSGADTRENDVLGGTPASAPAVATGAAPAILPFALGYDGRRP
jgi:hypothetical protein